MRTDFRNLDFEIIGESHSKEMRLIIYNMPKGKYIDTEKIDSFIQKRSNKSIGSTARKEEDKYDIISGVKDSYTTGEKIEIVVQNKDVDSSAYNTNVLRPSHVDYVSYLRDGKVVAGGGRFSGRLTVMICILGAIAASILNKEGIFAYSFISSIGKMVFTDVKNKMPEREEVAKKMQSMYPFYEITKAQRKNLDLQLTKIKGKDSLGGIIQSLVYVPTNLNFGDALFEGLESKLSYYIYSIPAVKGIEFGDGFDITRMLGSKANDQIEINKGEIKHISNHSGGIQGGIPNGVPIVISTAIKPTPSISIEQRSVDIERMQNTTISTKGRHDACIAMRIPICVESAIYIALLDEYIKKSKDIEISREKIDNIDSQIMQLLDDRIDICKEIGEEKKKQDLNVLDGNREEEILNKAKGLKNSKEIQNIYSAIFVETKKVQK